MLTDQASGDEEDEEKVEEDEEGDQEVLVESVETTAVEVDIEVEDTQMAESSEVIQTNIANLEETIISGEFNTNSPPDAIQEVNSTPPQFPAPIFSPKSTTPDRDIAPRTDRPTLPTSRQTTPVANMAIQMASHSAPPPSEPVSMPSFFE